MLQWRRCGRSPSLWDKLNIFRTRVTWVPRRIHTQCRIQDLRSPVIRHMVVDLSAIIEILVFRQLIVNQGQTPRNVIIVVYSDTMVEIAKSRRDEKMDQWVVELIDTDLGNRRIQPPNRIRVLLKCWICQSKYEEKRILEVQLGTRKILALLDSGCEQSVIGRSLIRKVPLEPTSEKLSTADGIDVPLLGETTIEFLVSGFQSQCRVVVSEAIDELILGIEWLQTNQCVWDFGSNSFAIEGHKGRLRCKKASKAVRRILVQDEIEISGWYSQEVPVLISRASLNNEKQNWGGSSRMADSDLLIASAIYDSADVQSVCQVVNMSDLPQRLRKGSELGEAEPVEILELNKQSESTIEKSWSRRSFIKSQKNCRIRKFLWNRGV